MMQRVEGVIGAHDGRQQLSGRRLNANTWLPVRKCGPRLSIIHWSSRPVRAEHVLNGYRR